LAAFAPLAFAATCASPCRAGDYLVPDDYPTIQDAVDEAAVSLDLNNVVIIGQSPMYVSTEVLIGADFNAGHRLVIRPGGLPKLTRATVASTSITEHIFRLETSQHVTFQDLDIVRYTTNRGDLMRFASCENVTLERCRVGSIWTAPGEPNHHILQITYPKDVIVRNSVFFSYLPGEFNRSIILQSMSDDDRSVFFYNNVVADYRDYGFEMDDGVGNAEAIIVLRNNVAINHPDLVVEPHAYHSLVLGPTQIVTSHNVAFATDDAHAEEVAGGARSITEQTIVAAEFLRFDPAVDLDGAFVSHEWVVLPVWDPNADFYILPAEGSVLHDEPIKWGVTVTEGSPHARDHAVSDDIQKDIRPGGADPHTDRGVDQLEPGVLVAVGPVAPGAAGLRATPLRNPAASLALRYASAEGGRLVLEVFDLGGRLLHRAAREIEAQAAGVFTWDEPRRSEMVFYRLRLWGARGVRDEARGAVVLLR